MVIIIIILDAKVDIENKSKNYRSRVNKMNRDERVVELNKLQEMFKKAVENSDNKVQIAMQMYEMVRKEMHFCWLVVIRSRAYRRGEGMQYPLSMNPNGL